MCFLCIPPWCYAPVCFACAQLQLLYGDGEATVAEGLADSAAGNKGLAVLDMVVQVASTCLTAFPGELTLHKQVRRGLLTLRQLAR